MRVRASQVRLGDRLLGTKGDKGQIVIQVSARAGEVVLKHGAAQTRFVGDPFVEVLRSEPRIVEEELPDTIWRPRGPRRIHPWEDQE